MNSYEDIIIAPIVTEKSEDASKANKYAFKVAVKANKTEIKQAIEKIFNVKVASVNTMNTHPKKRRVGKYTGLTKRYKKAVVTLKEGNTISFD